MDREPLSGAESGRRAPSAGGGRAFPDLPVRLQVPSALDANPSWRQVGREIRVNPPESGQLCSFATKWPGASDLASRSLDLLICTMELTRPTMLNCWQD